MKEAGHNGIIGAFRFDLGIAGLLFIIVCLALILAGDPAYWLFACAIALGLVIAALLHFFHRTATLIPPDNSAVLQDYPHQGITMHRLRFGAGFAGLVFTLGSMAVFLVGLPLLWYPFVGAIALGAGIATFLHFSRGN